MADFDFDLENNHPPERDEERPRRRRTLDGDQMSQDRPRRNRDDGERPRQSKGREKRYTILIVVIAGALALLAIVVYFVRQLPSPDINEHFGQRGKGFAGIADGSICKGHGDVQGVDSSGVVIFLPEGTRLLMNWNRDRSAAPKVGDRINFKCRVTVRKQAAPVDLPRSGSFEQARDNLQAAANAGASGSFDLLSWSQQ